MGKSIPIHIREETFWLSPEKAVFWENKETLLIADLHLGKSEHFQKFGIPVPSTVLFSDLRRLTDLVKNFGAKRLFVLGDLIHTPEGVTANVQEAFLQWRRYHSPLEILVVLGNHDRKLEQISQEWDVILTPEWEEGNFMFSHNAEAVPGKFVWGGHLHPMFQIGGRGDRVRVPCFWIQEEIGVLPSFSEFTRGRNIDPTEKDEVVLIGDVGCVPLSKQKRAHLFGEPAFYKNS